jgi:transposase
MLLSEGQMSDYKGAALMLPAMPKAKQLLVDKGYDADWFRAALAARGVAACIPSKSNRKVAIPHDALTQALVDRGEAENRLEAGRRAAGSLNADAADAQTAAQRAAEAVQSAAGHVVGFEMDRLAAEVIEAEATALALRSRLLGAANLWSGGRSILSQRAGDALNAPFGAEQLPRTPPPSPRRDGRLSSKRSLATPTPR